MDPTLLPSIWPGNCFACSARNAHGLKLQFVRTKEGVSARCELDRHLSGMNGVTHGGIVATLLDEAAAWALAAHAGCLGVTSGMNIRFVKPVDVAVPLVVQAFVVEHDAKVARTLAQVVGEQDIVLAAATSEWTLLSVAAAARLTGIDRDQLDRFIAIVHHPAGSE